LQAKINRPGVQMRAPKPSIPVGVDSRSQSCGSILRAPATHQIDDRTDQKDQAKATSAITWTSEVKAAAAEQKNENQDQKKWAHRFTLSADRHRAYGAFTCPMTRDDALAN